MIQHFSVFQPNAWDNSVVPINIIHKLINNLNEVIDTVNAMEDESFERSKAYTDEQITIVNNQIDNIMLNFDNLSRSVSNLWISIGELRTTETEHYNTVIALISETREIIEETKVYLKNYTDIKILELKNYLETQINEIKRLIDNLLDIETVNGFTGKRETIREILSAKIVENTKKRGGNRYAMTWGQLSITCNTGWLARYSTRIYNRINYIAPTWHNFMINNLSISSSSLYNNALNTWASFSNITLIFIADIVHRINQFCISGTSTIADNYKNVDVFKKSEWDSYITNGETVPTIERIDVTDLYDSTNTHVSLIVAQFKLSLGIFCGSVAGYGLYSSGVTTNALFGSTSDLPALFQFLQGNLNTSLFSNSFT